MRRMFAALAAAILTTALTLVPAGPAAAAFACSTVPKGGEVSLGAYLSAYDWWDNTPPGSEIAYRVFHGSAGGSGTYANPITMAVGWCSPQVPDYEPGTRFYIAKLRKYFIVEDLCGDPDASPTGNPRDIPCHAGYRQGGTTYRWLDAWINARTGTPAAGEACMDKITGLTTFVRNPRSTYPVADGGSIFESGCRTF